MKSLYSIGYSDMAKNNPQGKQALTELRIERLSITGKTYQVQDGAQPGLSLRVTAGGVKSFLFTVFRNNKFTQITLGRAGALRLDDARKAVQKLHGELAQGIDLTERRQAARQQRAASETLQEAFDRFLTLKVRRPSTLKDYEFLWRTYIPAGLKRKPVRDVTSADVDAAKRTVGKRHRTANKLIALLSAVMAKSGRRMDNPAQETTRHVEHVRTRRLTVDELQRVWAAAETDPEWRDFFRLLILTGARRSPFQAMRWRDLNLDAGVWIVSAEWSKNKREMAVPLSAEAVRVLRERLTNPSGKSPWVFPSAESKTGHVINPIKAWRRLLKAADVHEHTTLHDIRRTLGSRLAMDGVAGATISKVLGHVSAQSLKHYLHLDVTAGSEAIDRLFSGVITQRIK
jgi:integrase